MPSYQSSKEAPLLQAGGEPFRIMDSLLCAIEGCEHSPAAHASRGDDGPCRAAKCGCAGYLAPDPEEQPLHVWVRVILENLPRETLAQRGAGNAWHILQACGRASGSGCLELTVEQVVWLRKLLEEPASFEALGFPVEAVREILSQE